MSVALLVPRSLVKTVKSTLESGGSFGRRIDKVTSGGNGAQTEELYLITTTIPTTQDPADGILTALQLYNHRSHITISTSEPEPALPTRTPLDSAIRKFLDTQNLPTQTLQALLTTSPRRWSLYPPLLLFPPTAFTSAPWTQFLASLTEADKSSFYAAITSALGATHLAINAPIPASSTMRTPIHLTPLYGEFSTGKDAFWCSTVQNGIYQTWPPLHCMFSRGNIKEKARVLGFPSVRGEQVVDLYAGIGYFTFSYLKAGARRVWCWEINPWSVEALRRGAGVNGWGVRVVSHDEVVGVEELDAEGVRVCVFVENNEFAIERLARMGVKGIRHVNMGLLPDCRNTWGAAAALVSAGGWMHVHANVEEGGEGGYAEGAVKEFKHMLGDQVVCEHIEVVKTFAPGVVHCVFDIRVGETAM